MGHVAVACPGTDLSDPTYSSGSSGMIQLQPTLDQDCLSRASTLPWYAIRTKPKHEGSVIALLNSKGYEPYFPTYRVMRRWSDRTVTRNVALFPGYVFCRLNVSKRMPILTIPSVLSILGFGTEPAEIPDHEIDAIRTIVRSGIVGEPCSFLREGQMIRVNSGVLAGLQGILLRKRNEYRLVVSVSLLQRSLAVEVDRETISAL